MRTPNQKPYAPALKDHDDGYGDPVAD
jgi:hypothetical protein